MEGVLFLTCFVMNYVFKKNRAVFQNHTARNNLLHVRSRTFGYVLLTRKYKLFFSLYNLTTGYILVLVSETVLRLKGFLQHAYLH